MKRICDGSMSIWVRVTNHSNGRSFDWECFTQAEVNELISILSNEMTDQNVTIKVF